MANKVLIISSENFPFGGAASNFIRLMAKGLAYNGLVVNLHILKGYLYGKEINSSRKGIHCGIKFKYLSYKNRPKYKLLKILDDLTGILMSLISILIFRLTKGRKSILIFLDKGYRSFLPIIFSRSIGLSTYGIIVEGYDTMEQRFVQKIDNWIKFKLNNKLFSGIFVLSSFLESFYKNHYSLNQIFLQPNLLDLDPFKSSGIRQEKQNNGNIRFGYLGVPTEKDGINDLFHSFSIFKKKYPNAELLIIGDSLGGTLVPILEKRAITLGIGNDVIFTGIQSHENINGLLHSCDILILTRPDNSITRAGFPTKLGEYLACKKPVFLTSFGDIPLYFKDGINAVLSVPGNPEKIAQKMEQMVRNRESWDSLGLNGYNWAKDNLEYRKATKRLIDFFGLTN